MSNSEVCVGQREAAPTHISETSVKESLEDYRETRLGGKASRPELPTSSTPNLWLLLQNPDWVLKLLPGRILAGAKWEMENCIIHPVSSKEEIAQRALRKVEYYIENMRHFHLLLVCSLLSSPTDLNSRHSTWLFCSYRYYRTHRVVLYYFIHLSPMLSASFSVSMCLQGLEPPPRCYICSRPSLHIHGGHVPRAQWLPRTMDSTKPYVYRFLFSYTYMHAYFNL